MKAQGRTGTLEEGTWLDTCLRHMAGHKYLQEELAQTKGKASWCSDRHLAKVLSHWTCVGDKAKVRSL